jgi:hypothetical protein
MELRTAAVDRLFSAVDHFFSRLPDDERAISATIAAARGSQNLVRTFADVFLNPAQRLIPKQAQGREQHRRTETVVRARRRRPALFRKADLARAVKAMEKAGKEVRSAKIDKDGRIVVVCVSEPAKGETNEWDTVLK